MSTEVTSSKDFREKLSKFFDIALEKTVAISRGKDRFILMNEEEYLNLRDEVLSLQRNLIALLDSPDKRETIDDPEKFFSEVFEKNRAKFNSKKVKQASGQ
jgi:PHD/YefM family antitoxin component YafN of YafNO toxin-antitoxin module